MFTLLDLGVSSLRRGHANLLCIVPILTDDPRRESVTQRLAGPVGTHAMEHEEEVSSFHRSKRVERGSGAHWSKRKEEWSGAPCTQQRSLHCILIQDPTTAGSAQFYLLCCQPESMPRSLTARMSQLTPWDPCRLPAWSGRTIHMLYRTCHVPEHAISQDRMATGEWILPAKTIAQRKGSNASRPRPRPRRRSPSRSRSRS